MSETYNVGISVNRYKKTGILFLILKIYKNSQRIEIEPKMTDH